MIVDFPLRECPKSPAVRLSLIVREQMRTAVITTFWSYKNISWRIKIRGQLMNLNPGTDTKCKFPISGTQDCDQGNLYFPHQTDFNSSLSFMLLLFFCLVHTANHGSDMREFRGPALDSDNNENHNQSDKDTEQGEVTGR
jgi:hypothetical protein